MNKLKLKKLFDKLHEALAEISSELREEPPDVQETIEGAQMVLAPIRKLRLRYGVPYGHEEEEHEEEEEGERDHTAPNP